MMMPNLASKRLEDFEKVTGAKQWDEWMSKVYLRLHELHYALTLANQRASRRTKR